MPSDSYVVYYYNQSNVQQQEEVSAGETAEINVKAGTVVKIASSRSMASTEHWFYSEEAKAIPGIGSAIAFTMPNNEYDSAEMYLYRTDSSGTITTNLSGMDGALSNIALNDFEVVGNGGVMMKVTLHPESSTDPLIISSPLFAYIPYGSTKTTADPVRVSTPGESLTVEVKPGTTFVCVGNTSDDKWYLGSDEIETTGTYKSSMYFDLPASNSGYTIKKEAETSNAINTLSDLTGGMSDFTTSDFRFTYNP